MSKRKADEIEVPKFLRVHFAHEEGMWFYYVTFKLPDKLDESCKLHPAIACLGEIYGLPAGPEQEKKHENTIINDEWIGVCGPKKNPWKMSTCAELMFYANIDHLESKDDSSYEADICKIMTKLCGPPVSTKDAIGIIYTIVVPTYQ